MQRLAGFRVVCAVAVLCGAGFGQSTHEQVVSQAAPPASPPQSTAAAPGQSTAAAPAQSTQGGGQSGKGAPGPVTTLRTSANLVVVDVVVNDGGHKPVHGLTAHDFTIKENGVAQAAKSFEEHVSLSPADAAKLSPIPKLPPGVFTNYTPAPPSGSLNVVLLDVLNTPLQDQLYARQQLAKFLETADPSTRIAVFGLTTHLIMLQGFTSDPEVLKKVILKPGGTSPLLNDQVGGGGIQNSMADLMEEDSNVDPATVANVRDMEALTKSLALQIRAKYTLDAMNQLAKYLAVMPGRKNLIWFSGSFPLNILPDTSGTQRDPFIGVASMADEFRETAGLLAKSQVAVYPVDARGPLLSPRFSVETTRNYGGARGTARAQQDDTNFFTQTAEEQGTMLDMAAATGGRAFLNTNGLTEAVTEAVSEGSNFYTLTYSPTNTARDGKLRKIKVLVDRPGVRLAYRQGYYADRPALQVAGARMDAGTPSNPEPSARNSLRLAMMRGAPTPTEILLSVGLDALTPAGQSEDGVAPRNVVSPNAKGPYRRYGVRYAVAPSDLKLLQTPDRMLHADLDLLIFVYSATGELLNRLTDAVHINAPVDQVVKAAAQGMVFHEEISTPAKGEYFLRVAVRDELRDHYGAVEMATSAARKAVPAPTAGSAAGPGAPAKP